MATTRPDACRVAMWATGCLLAGLVEPAGAATRIQPTIDTEAVLTSNGNLNTNATAPARSDTVLTVSPGVNLSVVGANSELVGRWRFTAVHSMQGLQKNSIVPNGRLQLHTDVMRQGWGLDASVASSQVQSTFIGDGGSSTPTSNQRYTNTEWRVGPYLNRPLDANTTLSAKLTRGLQQTSQVDNSLTPRPDAHLRDDSISISRRATPLGYTLSRTWQSTQVSGQSDPVLSQDATKGSARYALTPELELGLLAGVERTRAFPTAFVDHPRGWLLNWRPSERTRLETSMEQRFFGRAWNLALNHRTPSMALGFNATRAPTTSLFSMGSVGAGGSARDLFDAMLTTRIPDAQERSQAVDELLTRRNIPSQLSSARDFYNLSAQLQQTVSGRLALMGRRDTWLTQAGLIKTRPLSELDDDLAVQALQDTRQTRQYYLESQVTHQLTPQSSLTGGLRWTRAREQILSGPVSMSRDFTWRVAMSTNLARDTTATVGLRRVLRHSPSTTSSDEAALFMGLGHRF